MRIAFKAVQLVNPYLSQWEFLLQPPSSSRSAVVDMRPNNATPRPAASFVNGLNTNKHPMEKQPAGELNHAIAYLNKIKARFADDPNTYKQFLDVLQTYQKEELERDSQDSQVYVQVQMLFKDAPDLLAEFKDFLPDAVVPPQQAEGTGEMPMPPQGGYPLDQSLPNQTRPPSSNAWTHDPDDGQRGSTSPNAEYHQQDGVVTREVERAVFGSSKHMGPPARPGNKSPSSARMFTNAQVNAISGGTFVNVAHIYEGDSPAQGGGPAFPIMVLGLQAVSFATRPHYSHDNHLLDVPPLLIPEPTYYPPMPYQGMKLIFAPFCWWLFIQMIKKWAIE